MWQIPIKKWSEISEKSADLVYQKALIELQETCELSKRVSDKSFWLLSVLIPVISLTIGYLLDYTMQTNWLVVIAAIVTLLLGIYVGTQLVMLIWPRKSHRVGSMPSEMMIEKYLFAEGATKQQQELSFLLTEIEVCQRKIEDNNADNAKRLRKVKFVMILIGAYLIAFTVVAIYLRLSTLI